MKRFFITSAFFIIVFVSLYSGLWFYNSNSVKFHTEEAILAFTKDIGGNRSDFTYEDTSISGFPFNYTVQINKPHFILNDKEISIDLSSDEPLIIESDILVTTYKAILPQNIKVRNGEKLEDNLTIIYTDAAQVTVESDTGNIFEKIASKAISDQEITHQFKKAYYSDRGYKYINPLNQEIIASADSSSIEINLLGQREYNLKANILNQHFNRFKELSDEERQLSNLDITADIIYNYNLGDKVTFNQFVVRSNNFSIDVQGIAASSNIEAFPHGDLEIKVSNYENFIDFQALVLNDIVKKSGLPVFNIKNKQIAQFKDFIGRVATEKSNKDKDIVISLKREEGQAINIGKYSFIEAVHIYNGGIIETVTTPASKEFIAEDIVE